MNLRVNNMAINIEDVVKDLKKQRNNLLSEVVSLEYQRSLLIATLEQIYVDEQYNLSNETLQKIESVDRECGGLL